MLIISIHLSCSSDVKENKITVIEKDYAFKGKELCGHHLPSGPTRFLSMDTVNKYGTRKQYHFEKEQKNDSIYISFKMNDDCCLTATGRLDVKNDSVFISGGLSGNMPCDCVCDYGFYFSLPHSKYSDKWIGMIITNRDGKNELYELNK